MNDRDKKRGDGDWVEWVVKVAGTLGFNEVKVRWKLTNWRQKTAREAALSSNRVRHAGYQHKICPHCGALQDKETRECLRCGRPMASHKWQVLARLGLRIPSAISMATLLMLVIGAVYIRMVLAGDEGTSIMGFSVYTLVKFGGHWPPMVRGGQWWRLGTAIFLHAGLMHIAFNLFALSQIGPPMEQLFGRARFLIFFMVTGLVGSIASHFFLNGVGIGASGAVLGIIGVGAGWGHREGTTMGLQLRNHMLQWLAYTVVFGFFIGADNVAHIAGFASGAALGYTVRPHVGPHPTVSPAAIVGFVLSLSAMLFFLYFAFFPQPFKV